MRGFPVWLGDLRRIVPRLTALLLGLATLLMARPAAAIEVACIESSRYGYLSKVFGDDKQAFGAYFNIDPNYLPPPEICRAAFVTGEIGPNFEDADKLIAVIAQNGGWLDTLYLDAYGTDVDGGIRLALVTRAFWLKTKVAPAGDKFVFSPDFGASEALTPDANRIAFNQIAATVATEAPHYSGGTSCDGTCAYVLAAGVDRHGVVRLERRPEQRAMKLYTRMGAGDVAAALKRTQGSGFVPFTFPRYPRELGDALLQGCKSDGAQLEDLPVLWNFAVTKPHKIDLAGVRFDTKDASDKFVARRREVRQCATALDERVRFEAFRRMCPSGCRPDALRARIENALEEMRK